MPEVLIRPNQRVASVGKTSSGKTYLERVILAPMPRLVVFDSKGSLGGADWNLDSSQATVRALKQGRPGRLRVTTPRNNDWVSWLRFIWDIQNVVLYIDEMMAVVPPRKAAPDELNALYTRGREFNIGVHASMQRPAWVPPFSLSEAEWIFLFRVSRADDRKYVADFGDEYGLMREPIRDEHGFWTYHQTWRKPIYTQKLTAKRAIPTAQGERLPIHADTVMTRQDAAS